MLSVGDGFQAGVMKKPLSMGADELVLVQDEPMADLDPYATAHVLSRAIAKLGGADLVLCGRQASRLGQRAGAARPGRDAWAALRDCRA